MNVILYKRFELRRFGVLFDSVEPKVLHVLCHCYAAINISIKIFKVLITFSYIGERGGLKKQGKVRKAVSFFLLVLSRNPSYKKIQKRNVKDRIEFSLFSISRRIS